MPNLEKPNLDGYEYFLEDYGAPETRFPQKRLSVFVESSDGLGDLRPGTMLIRGVDESVSHIKGLHLVSNRFSLTEITDDETGALEGWEITLLPHVDPLSNKNFCDYLNQIPAESRSGAVRGAVMDLPSLSISEKGLLVGPEDVFDTFLEPEESFEQMMIRRKGYMAIGYSLADEVLIAQGVRLKLPIEVSILLRQEQEGEVASKIDNLIRSGEPIDETTLNQLLDIRMTILPPAEYIPQEQ